MPNQVVLPPSFYASEIVVNIAKKLLGKVIIANTRGGTTIGMIVETEAYEAPQDKASHAYGNKRTPRTETMFATPGTCYMYICYGIHHLFNIITAPKGIPHAILIRAIEPKENVELMIRRRKMKTLHPTLVNGPGKFTMAMGINIKHNGLDLTKSDSRIRVEDHGIRVKKSDIIAGPRVGMTSAQECKHWPYRFRIKDNKWTSKPDTVIYD